MEDKLVFEISQYLGLYFDKDINEPVLIGWDYDDKEILYETLDKETLGKLIYHLQDIKNRLMK